MNTSIDINELERKVRGIKGLIPLVSVPSWGNKQAHWQTTLENQILNDLRRFSKVWERKQRRFIDFYVMRQGSNMLSTNMDAKYRELESRFIALENNIRDLMVRLIGLNRFDYGSLSPGCQRNKSLLELTDAVKDFVSRLSSCEDISTAVFEPSIKAPTSNLALSPYDAIVTALPAVIVLLTLFLGGRKGKHK